MILYEFEGKNLLKSAGIDMPVSQLVKTSEESLTIGAPVVLKAQTLSGKRKDAGGIVVVDRAENIKVELAKIFNKTINKEKVESVLVEEKAEYSGPEYYISISYDGAETRGPIMIFSQEGGTGIEGRAVKEIRFNVQDYKDRKWALSGLPDELVQKIVNLFFDADCLLLEINPLVMTKNGFVALDAKVKIDDAALGRHKDWAYPPRSIPGRAPTVREIEAKKIDEGDYRGTAGSAYFDLPGDIAILASGGGGSLTALDALLAAGGKPANYTEYSGNPPKEKVEKLAKVVMSREGLSGLWVVGAIANFTDIYETLSGLMDGLRKAEKDLGKKFDFPIVVRRGGPRDKEAFEMLRQVKDFDLHLYGEETSIAESAKIITKLAAEYATKHDIA